MCPKFVSWYPSKVWYFVASDAEVNLRSTTNVVNWLYPKIGILLPHFRDPMFT